MRGSKFPADMHNYICIPSFIIIGSVVSEELQWQDFGMDGRTDGWSDCTPRPAFAFGDAGKNIYGVTYMYTTCCYQHLGKDIPGNNNWREVPLGREGRRNQQQKYNRGLTEVILG